MKIPEHLNKPLLEQLADQADSDDFLVMRGSALGYGLLEDMEKRNEYIQKFIDNSFHNNALDLARGNHGILKNDPTYSSLSLSQSVPGWTILQPKLSPIFFSNHIGISVLISKQLRR